jgi:hypothetical protein
MLILAARQGAYGSSQKVKVYQAAGARLVKPKSKPALKVAPIIHPSFDCAVAAPNRAPGGRS